jgi:hypothetical protein
MIGLLVVNSERLYEGCGRGRDLGSHTTPSFSRRFHTLHSKHKCSVLRQNERRCLFSRAEKVENVLLRRYLLLYLTGVFQTSPAFLSVPGTGLDIISSFRTAHSLPNSETNQIGSLLHLGLPTFVDVLGLFLFTHCLFNYAFVIILLLRVSVTKDGSGLVIGFIGQFYIS